MDSIVAIIHRSLHQRRPKIQKSQNARAHLSVLLRVVLVVCAMLGSTRTAFSDVSAADASHSLFMPMLAREYAIQGSGSTDLLIPNSSTWKYLDEGSDQGTAWRNPSFQDKSWLSGPAELGYGDNDEKTVLEYGSDPMHKYVTTYFRNYFTISDLSTIERLTLNLKRDDGAIVYLNGTEVFRSNMPAGEVIYQTYAKSSGDAAVSTSLEPGALVEGTNVIAVEIHQASPSSSDISFKLELIAHLAGGPAIEPTQTATTKPTVEPTLPPTTGNVWYVTTNGTASGSGSASSPWSIEYALSHPPSVQPGDTIWLRGGIYGLGGDDPFESNLEGASEEFITVRAYPGEHVVIDGGIFIWKPFTIFWGLEVLNTNGIRVSAEGGSSPSDIEMSDGFGVYASNTKLINNIIHDTSGIGAWERAVNVELYGNIVYNSGWEGTDRGHGHGLYMQNDQGTKTIVDNIVFNNFSDYNIHIYTESAHIQGFYLEGNVSFNGRFLIGGLQPAASIELDHNYFYDSELRLGYSSEVVNHDLSLTNNYLSNNNGDDLLQIQLWDTITSRGNVFHTPNGKTVVYENNYSGGQYSWNDNSYYANQSPFVIGGSGKSWDNWRSSTGFDQNSSYNSQEPSGVDVIVRPNRYEEKRANIIIYNWDQQNQVTVDLSNTGLKPGDTYVLHNGQNYNETITGTYTGSPISIPMSGWTIAKPAGYATALAPATFPDFGVFVIDVK